MVGSLRSQSSLAALPCSLGLLRPVSRTARGLRAPHQFPLKSYGFPGAETARKRFLLWKMGFSAAAYCEPLHPSIQHGRPTPSHRPALTLARCSVAAHCASLRVLATSALRASDVRKLTRGAPCFTGLIGGYCSHWLRRLFRPHWTSASPVSRTARGEAPSHRRRPPCAPQKMPEMTYTPSFLI